MCLQKILGERPAKSGTMWKVFSSTPKGLLPQIFWHYNGQELSPYQLDTWVSARKVQTKPPALSGEKTYISGFHGFTSQADAMVWAGDYSVFHHRDAPRLVVLQVQYRGGRLMGLQDEMRVIVADEILIPSKGGRR